MINKEDANILIVDDIEDNRYTLERRLKRDGYTNIFSAEGGKTALDMASQNKFDLILLDLMMPDMSGLEVLKYLKGNPLQRTIPVIMVTASDEVETAAECIINGADDFITKPFNGTLLKARVGASLEKKRLRDSEENYLDRVVESFIIGESCDFFATQISQHPKRIRLNKCTTLKNATELAIKKAKISNLKKIVILLSPSAASFDQFKNFEERGNKFKEIIDNQLREGVLIC